MSAGPAAAVDPVATEIVRQGLNAAAEQMKRALVRTAFSPVVYEVLDFAAALYDRDIAMLAQAPSLPTFMGTMSFCVRAAVDAVGGEDALEPGDIVIYNVPYGTGSHPQDVAMVMPVFVGGELIGYSAIKAHWLDIGGKDPYSTDTVDVFQEGTIFPGVKLYAGGRLVEDIFRFAVANSRVPKMVAGDINATVVGVRTGAAALARLVERHGLAALPREHGAHLRARRGRRAAVVRAAARRSLRRSRRDGLERRDRRPRAVRRRRRDRGLARPARLHRRARRSRRARSTARCPRPSRPAGSRSPCWPAAARRRPRVTSARSRSSRGRARSSTRCIRHRASCTAGPATRRSRRSTGRSPTPCPRPFPPVAAATSAPSSGGASGRAPASRGRTARLTRSARARTRAATARAA